ncbi:MAG: putative toxin-antitoxin system toxin component, PIN family [Bryobacteraceae bacterium]|jgi:putative PIN family toxin of toxin-antitoxin system
MRIVLDTNILARANPHSKGVARTLLLTILESADHVLVLSPFLLRETERVLNYPRLQAIWPLTPLDIEQYTQALQDFAELVNPQIGARLVPNDQEDDPVLETALSGRADVLCTLDRHFHHRTVLKSCSEHGIQILTDVELLSVLREASPPRA